MSIVKYLLLGLSFFVIMSCKKDKEEDEAVVVVKDFTMEALTSKSWKQVTVDGNLSINPPAGTYLYMSIGDWERDDRVNFTTDNKVLYNYGSWAAPAGLEGPATNIYTVNLTNKTINIGGETFQLLDLSATRLKYSRYVANNPSLIFMFEHP